VFVRSYLELDQPCGTVTALLLQMDRGWLTAVVEESARWEGDLLVRVGLGPPHPRTGRRDTITVGPPALIGGGLLLPLSWRSTERLTPFSRVEADLQAAPLGPDLTQLSINARYQPSARSEVPDRALRHRVAEAVVADLLRRVASGLRARMEGPAGARADGLPARGPDRPDPSGTPDPSA
jgi:hypothetical protein